MPVEDCAPRGQTARTNASNENLRVAARMVASWRASPFQPNAPPVLAAVTKLLAVSVPRLESSTSIARTSPTRPFGLSPPGLRVRATARQSWAAATIPRVRLLLG